MSLTHPADPAGSLAEAVFSGPDIEVQAEMSPEQGLPAACSPYSPEKVFTVTLEDGRRAYCTLKASNKSPFSCQFVRHPSQAVPLQQAVTAHRALVQRVPTPSCSMRSTNHTAQVPCICLLPMTFAWCSAPAILACAAWAPDGWASGVSLLSLLLPHDGPRSQTCQEAKKSVVGQGSGEGAVSLQAGKPCKQMAVATHVSDQACPHFLQGSVIDDLCTSVQRPRPGRQGAAAKVQGKAQQLLSRPMVQIIQDINEENLRRAVQQSETFGGMLEEEQDPLLQQALQDSAQEAEACAGVTALTMLSMSNGGDADSAWYQGEWQGRGQY